MREINLSEWNLDRIEVEQKKHRFGLIAHGIPQVDLSEKSIEDLDSITTAIEVIAKKATEEQELFIICELAKLYIESQRPAEWIAREDMNFLDENKVWHFHFMCEKCGLVHDFIDGHTSQYNFCPNCGRRMKRGDV